jgi:hypothetical protein
MSNECVEPNAGTLKHRLLRFCRLCLRQTTDSGVPPGHRGTEWPYVDPLPFGVQQLLVAMQQAIAGLPSTETGEPL